MSLLAGYSDRGNNFQLLTEKIWIPSNRCSQISVGTFLPFILEISAVDALQAHVCHAASHDVEASGKCNDIVLTLYAIRCDDALLRKLFNRGPVLGLGVDVDNIDLVAVQDFVVVLLKAGTLDAEGVGWLFREENLILSGVFNTRGLLASPKIL